MHSSVEGLNWAESMAPTMWSTPHSHGQQRTPDSKDKLDRQDVWGTGREAASIPAFTYLNPNLAYVPALLVCWFRVNQTESKLKSTFSPFLL